MKLSKLYLISKLKVGTEIFDKRDTKLPFGIITEVDDYEFGIDWYRRRKNIGLETIYGSKERLKPFLDGELVLLRR